mgnify:CR=1 FL=1
MITMTITKEKETVMSKKTNKIAEKVLLGMAIGSVMIAFIEGVFYYNAESYPNVLIRCMLILQNTIRAFGFKSDIGIKDVAKVLQESTFIIEIIINYIYLIVLFIAPYCTVSYIYKFLEKIFRLRRKNVHHPPVQPRFRLRNKWT